MSAEEKSKKVLRVNQHTSTHLHQNMSTKVDPRTIAGGAVINPRNEHTATAVNRVVITNSGPYRTGDGDVKSVYRPGSQDFLKYPSKGHLC